MGDSTTALPVDLSGAAGTFAPRNSLMVATGCDSTRDLGSQPGISCRLNQKFGCFPDMYEMGPVRLDPRDLTDPQPLHKLIDCPHQRVNPSSMPPIRVTFLSCSLRTLKTFGGPIRVLASERRDCAS